MNSDRGRGRGYTPESSRDILGPLRRPPVIWSSSGSRLCQSHFGSTLNASAVEFIPRIPELNLPDVLAENSLSSKATEFATGTAALEVNVFAVNVHAELHSYTYSILDAVLNTPSEFDMVTEGYADYLTTKFSERKAIEVVCESILEIASAFDNFSYMCGRLCRHIHENVSNNHGGTFIQHMLATCRKAHADMKAQTPDRTYLRRFTLFMAELYDIEPIGRVLELIIELLKKLLEDINNENAKTICQTLKLRGGSLEDFFQHTDSPSMGRLMEKIYNCNTGGLSSHVRKMVSDLPSLRATNWGRVSASPVPTATSSIPADDEPVFYSPAGQIIDRAEAAHLYGIFEMVEDDGMTDEMYDDYERFMNELPYIQKYELSFLSGLRASNWGRVVTSSVATPSSGNLPGGFSPHIQKVESDLSGLITSNRGHVSVFPVATPTSSTAALDVLYKPMRQISIPADAGHLSGSKVRPTVRCRHFAKNGVCPRGDLCPHQHQFERKGGLSPHIQKMVSELSGLMPSNHGRLSVSPVAIPTSSTPAHGVFYNQSEQIRSAADTEQINGGTRPGKRLIECAVCGDQFDEKSIALLPCHDSLSGDCCLTCAKTHFEIKIKSEEALSFSCPICEAPNAYGNMEVLQNYFEQLSTVTIPGLRLSAQVLDLYHSKININWVAVHNDEVIYCPDQKCSTAFMTANETVPQCPKCRVRICGKCKNLWDDRHKGSGCEQFDISTGRSDHSSPDDVISKLFTVNCPKCETPFDLERGGCDHMTCLICKHQFCRGCLNPFTKSEHCPRYQELKCDKGFHSHHPRNCWFYLRDEKVEDLQQLLRSEYISFEQDCQYFKVRDIDNAETLYKEYLVHEIAKHGLDPACMKSVSTGRLEIILRNEGISIPSRGYDTDIQYRQKLIAVIQQKLPLHK